MKTLSLILAVLCCCSCSIYQGSFDSPPGKGVGCKSVGEVLDMIVERESSEDLFVSNIGHALALREEEAALRKYAKTSRKVSETLRLVQTETGELALEKEDNSGEEDL